MASSLLWWMITVFHWQFGSTAGAAVVDDINDRYPGFPQPNPERSRSYRPLSAPDASCSKACKDFVKALLATESEILNPFHCFGEINLTVERDDTNNKYQTESEAWMAIMAQYEVLIKCSVKASVDSIIFSTWMHSDDTQIVGRLDNIVTNWKFKPMTCLQDKDSLMLIRPQAHTNESLNLNFNISRVITSNKSNLITESDTRFLEYAIFDCISEQLHHERLQLIKVQSKVNHNHFQVKSLQKRATSMGVSGYLIVANRLYIHHISLDGSRTNVAISGLKYAVAIDFHFRSNSLYFTDSSQQAIMRSTLDGAQISRVLDHGLTQPESLSVDWINNKLYWTDVRGGVIGVLDLVSHNYKHSLISMETSVSPRGLVVDSITRALYWTEWGQTQNARIRKASMDGRNMTILYQDNLQWPYGVTMDFDNQILYWTDSYFDKIECGNVDGTGRRVVISLGLENPFDLTLLGNTLYISDWNLGILATNRSGGQPIQTVYNTFCDSVQTFGIQAVAEERQLLAENPCDGGSGRRCSHLCLLSSVNSSGFSCVCPDGMTLDDDRLTCSQLSGTNLTVSTIMDSCRMVGYESCCRSGVCNVSLSLCFCDSDCYHYGDCCNDIEDTCSSQTGRGAYLLISNVLYIHRVSLDGLRMKTLDASTDVIKSVDYNYWTNHIYWSTSNQNGLWQSQLDGSGVMPILTEGVQTIDDIAVDWISNKLYWTDSGQISRIRVLDITSGYYTSIINTGTGTSPRAIVVDPIHRILYWSDWGSVAKIETASMDGENRTVIIDTDLVWPSGLTIDYAQQILYWTDNNRGRIESSNVDGSNRITISSQRIYQPFGISVYRSTLYYTDFISGVNTLNVSRGSVRQTILNSLCEDASGIEVFSIEKQPTGTNPCQVGNGGCSHICLLSSVEKSGFSCACPDDLSLDEDAQTCVSTSTPITTTQGPMIRQGTCIAAGYTGGCCTSGTCRGSPPTCSCDSTCHIFRDCCSDVPPSCQPAIDVLEFVSVPSNVTTTLDDDTQQQQSQFHCSVRASRVTNFQWTFTAATNHESLSSLNGSPQQISNQVGSLDSKYSVVSSDYSSELIVTDVQFSDTGIYTCIASIGSRISPIESSAFHTVEVLPKLPEISGSYSFSVEEKIRLWCRVEAHPQPSLVWIVRSPITMKRIVPTTIASVVNSHITVNSGNPYSRSELTIDNVNSNDGGDYICAATANKYSLVRSSSHSITVTSTNECEISRSPCLNGGTCINNYGRYHCICPSGYNGRNCSQRIESFSYSIKPFFTSTPLNEVTVELGHSTNLTCGATGYPTPIVQWYKDGVQILGENEPLLFISEVLPDDRGNYSCKATNSEGVIESGQTQISIQRILQYTAVLKCNETLNFSDSHEILMLIADSSFLNGHGIVYSIKYLEDHTNLSDSALLLTLLTMDNMPPYDIIRKLLVSELMEICSVVSLSRFDGCETNSHSELELGGLLEVPCPCHEYLWMLPNVMNQAAWRSCGGSYTNGSELLDTDFSQCITVTDQRTSNLCQAAMSLQGAHEYPYDIVESVLNTTSDQQLSSVADIALLAVIVELLTIEAITNPKVREAYLKIIDYFQGLDPHHLSKSQSLTNSSTRVLDSLEQFASAVSIIDINRNSTITEYTYLGYQSYGITLVDLDASTITSEYPGQTFSAKWRKNSVTKVTEWTMAVVDSLVEDDSISESLATSLHLPKQFLNGCVSASSSGAIRVAYFVFSTSVLFQSMSNEEQVIGSVVTSAQLNCTYDQMLPPIRLMYKKSTEGNQKQSCASMSRGLWSTTICQESLEGGHGLIGCNCYQLSYFGLLFESIPVTISVWVYVAVVFSFLFLIILFVMIAITESRLFSKAERIVLFNIDLTLILNYFLFLLGVNITSIPVLCGINSGVLQFITLVFYCWLAAQPILTFCRVSQRSEALFIKCITVLSWILPLLIVGLTAAIWYKSYVVTYFCGVTDFPLWFGLILPVALIGSIHFFAIALLFCKLVVKNNRTRNTTSSSPMNYHSKRLRAIILAVAVFFTFYSGFIFGLLSVNRRLSHYSKHFQAIYSILIMIQGPLLIAHIFCCSVRDTKQLRMYKLLCCLYYNDARIGNLSDNSHHTSTTDSGTNSLSSAEMFKANSITTDINPSYQTDIDKWKKNEFSMTRSEVYDTVKWSKNEFSMTRNVVYDTVK